MKNIKMEVSEEEKALIDLHRKAEAREMQKMEFMKTVVYIYSQWLHFHQQTGAGLTYSTFTNESEFNASQYLKKDYEEYRQNIYNYIYHTLPNLKRLSNELF